jgi:ATP-binding cassette subfamily B protein
LKARVVWATVFLFVAKLVLVAVPYFFKWATDALAGDAKAPPPLPDFMLGPVALVIAYNIVRIVQVGLNQLRDALFARVGQHAVRQLAYRTFVHMHDLSLRFHLERRTGGLSRIIERGTKGIETIVRFTILNTVPTVLEFALTAVIFALAYGWVYVLVVAVTVALYTWFTVWASDWRIAIRREMNDSDTDANTKAIDSLLNFETVKYFNNERMEAQRFDRSMARYEAAATRTWTSLGWLNFGQGVIFGGGMLIVMCLSALEVMAGTQTIGDFVFINAMLMQLSVPLNFIGFIYREIRQGLTDIENMFELLDVPAEVQDKPDAGPLAVKRGTVRFDDVHFSYDANRRILKGISFEVPAGRTVAIVGPSGAGKSTVSRLLFRFYDARDGQILIDGQNVEAIGGEGVTVNQPLTRADFEDLSPAILLESPTPGEEVRSPIELRGTSNTFEAMMQIEIIDGAGEIIYEDFATATSGSGTRGTFNVSIDVDIQNEGFGSIIMYEESAEDGSRINEIEIPVDFRN